MPFKNDEQRKAFFAKGGLAALRKRFRVKIEPLNYISSAGASFRLGIHDKDWRKYTPDAAIMLKSLANSRVAEIDVRQVKTAFGEKYGDVHTSWVAQPYRGKRLGTALYLLAYRQARRHGMSGLSSSAHQRNSDSNAVWSRIRSDTIETAPPRTEHHVAQYIDVMTSFKDHRTRRGLSLKEKREQKQKKLF